MREESPTKYAEIVAMLCPTEATVTQQDSQYAAMAAMSEEERDDYLMELLEQYWAG